MLSYSPWIQRDGCIIVYHSMSKVIQVVVFKSDHARKNHTCQLKKYAFIVSVDIDVLFYVLCSSFPPYINF